MSAAEFEKVVLSELADLLRPLGFKKQRRRFLKTDGDMELLVALQGSTSSTSEVLKFTLNVGLRFVPLKATSGDHYPLGQGNWHWGLRIGDMMPRHADYWWTLTSLDEATRAAAECKEAVERYALPRLFEMASPEALLRKWEQDHRRGGIPREGPFGGRLEWYLEDLRKLLGKTDEAAT